MNSIAEIELYFKQFMKMVKRRLKPQRICPPRCIHERQTNNAKNARRLLNFKAADGRKLCKDAGNNVLKRDKRVRPVAGIQRVLRIVSQY